MAEYPEPISFTKAWHCEPYPFLSPFKPELSMSGKNVVITGGGTGIGNAIAVAFAKAGAKSVSILGRRLDKLKLGAESITRAVASGGIVQVLFEVADIREAGQLATALHSIVDKVGNIDILVSNANSMPPSGPIANIDTDQFVNGVTDNIRGALNTFQAFLQVAGPSPIFLNTSSCLANIAPVGGGLGGYSVSKAACLKMMDCLTVENPNVHITNLHPGWVATEPNGYQEEAPDSGKLFSLVHLLRSNF
ncbi:hypothetical protein BDV59DRAFT_179213 [Aspergillus ambiguus]|uniref:SDR family NAD(P)-dependent oxidoreductase n=1 Tax=Aspergillus ambiguus TaxID=176160 RepID=UPI003CCD7AB6